MDSNDVFDQSVKIGFGPVLTYAACEWFLIFLMFIDALLSYLVVWFARYCRLQMPCFLCSKFLHPLHWRLLLCRNHKSEVSSFMSCHNHDNLADCRGMCDDCLLSFTKMSGPNPDMNRSLLGKLGYDLLSKSQFTHPRSCSCCNKPWRTRHHTQRLIQLGSRGRNSTSKPNIPAPRHLTRRGSSGSLKKIRDHKATSGSEYVDIGSRSDGMAHVGYTELKLYSDSDSDFLFSTDEAFFPITDFNVEPSEKRAHKSHSRKSFEHKKMSKHKKHDLQDNHYKNNHVEDYKNVKPSMPELNVADKTKHKPVEAEDHETVLSELINMSEARPFPLGLLREEDAGLAAQNENEAEISGNSSPVGGEFLSPSGENGAFREFQIQDDSNSAQNISSSAVNTEAPEASTEQKVSEHLDVSGSDATAPSSDEENVGEGDSKPLPSNSVSDPLEQEESSEKENEVNENNVAEEYFSNEEEEDEVNEHSKPLTSENVSGSFAEKQSSEEEDGSNDYSAAKSHSSKEGDADNRDSEPVTSENLIGSATEEHSCKEEHREAEPLATPKIPNEESSLEHSDNDYLVAKSHSSKEEDAHNRDSEPVTSDNVTCSAAVEHSGKEEHGETESLASPKISNEESSLDHNDNDSSKATETRNSPNESPVLNHSASVESFVSISSDIEGEHLVDLLKKQLEHDRKCLKELSKELEEERNASAIATNQAMAMITRLQEEKAALHMEVLQYLRMMDEQTEHDVDALERANNILTDREKEIQDLEMELEYYRLKYPDEPREEILASMGILGDIETSGTPTIDETSNQDPTDTTPSPGI